MSVELSVTISGDEFIEAVLDGDSGTSVIAALEDMIEAEVAQQTRDRVEQWSEETDRAIDYQPEVAVTVTR